MYFYKHVFALFNLTEKKISYSLLRHKKAKCTFRQGKTLIEQNLVIASIFKKINCHLVLENKIGEEMAHFQKL